MEIGYRLLEDALLSDDKASMDRAIDLYHSHPLLRVAAAKTFSTDAIEKSFKDNGTATATAVERHRLRQYAVIATNEELESALAVIEMIEGHDRNIEAEKAKQRRARADAAVEETLSLKRDLEASRAKAFFRCNDAIQCEKAFALTQIFISTHSDMKIQMANDTIIETFNPNKEGVMGATAIKFPLEGSSAEIRLAVSCKVSDFTETINTCLLASTQMNLAFNRFMRLRLLK